METGLKFYIAAAYERRGEALALALALEHVGYELGCQWVYGGEETPDTPAAYWAVLDMDEVKAAPWFIHLSDGKGTGNYVELGLALADPNKYISVIGPNSTLFHSIPGLEQFADLTEFAKKYLDGWVAPTAQPADEEESS